MDKQKMENSEVISWLLEKDNRAYWKYTGKYWQMNHFDPANLMSFL